MGDWKKIIINLESLLGNLTVPKGRSQKHSQVGAACIWNILTFQAFFISHLHLPVWQTLDLTRTLLTGTFTKAQLFLGQENKHIFSKLRKKKTQQTSKEPSHLDYYIYSARFSTSYTGLDKKNSHEKDDEKARFELSTKDKQCVPRLCLKNFPLTIKNLGDTLY